MTPPWNRLINYIRGCKLKSCFLGIGFKQALLQDLKTFVGFLCLGSIFIGFFHLYAPLGLFWN